MSGTRTQTINGMKPGMLPWSHFAHEILMNF